MMYLHGLDKYVHIILLPLLPILIHSYRNMLSAMSGNASRLPSPPAAADEGAESISTPGIQNAKEGEKSDTLNEVDDLLGKIYSNQSACHMKKGNWKRAVETAEKVRSSPSLRHKMTPLWNIGPR